MQQEEEQSLMQEGQEDKAVRPGKGLCIKLFFVSPLVWQKCEQHKNDTTWGSVLLCTLHFEKHFLLELGRWWGSLGDINLSTAAMIIATYWKSSDQVLLEK